MKSKMLEMDTRYTTASMDVLSAYESTATSLAKRVAKRKSACSEPDGVAATGNDETVHSEDDDGESADVKTRDDKDVLFGMALKKFRGVEWSDSEKRTLDDLNAGSPFVDINLALSGAVVSLLKQDNPLSDTEISVLKLSLSGIVNHLNKDQFNAVKKYLPNQFDQSHVDDVVATIRGHRMKDETESMYQSILDALESEENPVERALLQIDAFKVKFLKNDGRKTEGYIMLKVVEYLLETLDDWKQDDSETTIYRRIATIFDFMFRDTQVKLADGETTCDSTQNERHYNDIVFDSSSNDRQLFGRKIDLLIKYGKDVKSLELSSNEFKKPTATTSQVMAQQNKNLRVNGSILNHLRALNKKIHGVLAMDWIGNIGYLYCLVDEHGLYVAKSIDVLNIPTSVSGMNQFKNTLRLLFAYKHDILRTGSMAEHGLNERQSIDRLRGVIDVSVVAPEPTMHHDIFFTPTNSRIKKVKITKDS